ncbi:MAG: hypothetical protein H6735_01525 [Alphaproteobacteria bacterium]|nr:hypothetical protein [Alphaproteobacteria bacterium]
MLRLLAEAILLGLATRLIRIDRTAGLVLGSGVLLAIVGEVGVPLVGWGGIFAMSSMNPSAPPFPEDGPLVLVFVAGWFVLENLGPIGNALASMGCAMAIHRLMGRIPEEAWDRNIERS